MEEGAFEVRTFKKLYASINLSGKMTEKQKIGEKLRKFSLETRLKSSNELKDKIVGMFKGYIKAVVVWGSVTRGDFTGKSDVDIYVIFDDTKMPLKKFDEIRDKVDKDIHRLANDTDPRLHVQPVIALTEFWDGVRTCHPLFYNIVREGYAIHDTGFFIPMRKLLEWGKFPATVEAAEIRMEGVPKRITRVKSVKLYMIAEDIYVAMLDAAQSVLTYIGIGPPPPKVAPRDLRKHLVEAGLLEEKYAKMLEDVIVFRKAVEHKEIKDISGKELDEWIAKAEDYVKRFDELLTKLEVDRKAIDINKNYEVMVKASVAALKSMNKLPPQPEKLPEAFKKYLIESGAISPWYADVFSKVMEMKKMLQDKQLDKVKERDVYMNKEYVRRFIMDVRRVVEGKGEKIQLPPMEKDAKEKLAEAKSAVQTAKETKTKMPAIEPGEILPLETEEKEKRLDKVEKKISKEQKKHKK